MTEPAAVRNAADRDQVKNAERRDRDRHAREMRDLAEVLRSDAGRRVLWRMLEHCKVFESIWHPSALIHAQAGRQDVGHWLMAQIAAADEEAIFVMMKEARALAKRDRVELEAVQQTKKDTT